MEEAKVAVSLLALITAIIAIVFATRTAQAVKSRDLEHDRRRLFITSLWDRLTAVRGINPSNADVELVLGTLNTLELVALCWNSNLVDRGLVFRAFAESYCSRVKEIEDLTRGGAYPDVLFSQLGMDGPTLLRASYTHVKAVADELATMQAKQRANQLKGDSN